MTEKEAYQVVCTLNVHECSQVAAETYQLGIGRGYIEALRKADGLEEALKDATDLRGHEYQYGAKKCLGLNGCWKCEWELVLAKYNKEK